MTGHRTGKGRSSSGEIGSCEIPPGDFPNRRPAEISKVFLESDHKRGAVQFFGRTHAVSTASTYRDSVPLPHELFHAVVKGFDARNVRAVFEANKQLGDPVTH